MASISVSSQTCFENNISDDDNDDDDEGDVKHENGREKSDANENDTTELDWDLFSVAGNDSGSSSFQETIEHVSQNVNEKPDQAPFQNLDVETSRSESLTGKHKTTSFPQTSKEMPLTNWQTEDSQPDKEGSMREVYKTVDFNHEIAVQRPQNGKREYGDDGKQVSAAIASKPKRTNKNASNPDRMKPKTEVPTEIHTASEWVLTDEDLKGLSAYTGRATHAKQNRKIVSCHGYIPTDVSDFKLPPITGTFRIQPKSMYKMTLFMPLCHVAKVANSNETDDDAIIANLTSAGITEYVPCMQCYGSSGYSSVSGTGWEQEFQRNGKCQRCGGTLTSSLDAVKALRRLQKMFQADNLIVQDVRNDGNCLFAAVVDQLRTQGLLEHDIYSIREASVQYLREHPFSDDGSRLDAFLVNETWEHYLLRMSGDGEWGDHMILNAIAEVLHMQIVIYGGIADQHITTIVPKSCSRRDIKGDVRIGHLIESHYISLRKNDWMQTLDTHQGTDHVHKTGDERGNGNFPLMHLDMIMKLIIQCEHVQSLTPHQAWVFSPPFYYGKEESIHLVGDFISEAMPTPYSGPKFESIPLSNAFSRESNERTIPVFYTPSDTKARYENDQASPKDVIVCGNPAKGPIKLIPVKPSLWKGLVDESKGTPYLKTFKLTVDVIPQVCKSTIESVSKAIGLDAKCIITFWCEWPTFALEWVSRSRPGMFPTDKLVHSIFNSGCDIVPYFSQPEYGEVLDDCVKDSEGDENIYWCMSFAVAERRLFKSLSSEQRSCFLIYRAIVEQSFAGHVLPSSIVKSIFLYACENIPQNDWKRKAGHCLLLLLRITSNAFSRGFLAHYFISSKNMLSGLSESVLGDCSLELQKCCSRPIAALNHVLETLNIASSEIGPVLDQIICDMGEFFSVGNAKQSFVNCLYPSFGYLIQMMIMHCKYANALSALQDVQIEFENVFAKQINLEQLTIYVLTKSNFCKQWTFALFVDLRLGTNITSTICHGMQSIHISEVFGPKATELLTDTFMPESANIKYGNLTYAQYVADILQQLKRDDAFIATLKYYLETYAAFAGEDLVLSVGDETARNDIIAASAGMTKLVGSKAAVAEYQLCSALPMCLSNLHVRLFNKCWQTGKPDEYRSLLPTYQSVAKLGMNELFSRNASKMEQCLSGSSSETMLSRVMGSDSFDSFAEHDANGDVALLFKLM